MSPVRVSWEIGAPPNFRSQRTKALLGYLAVEKRPVSRDVLAAFFWPDETISKAKANLRKELYNLNNILPGCWQTDVTIVKFNSGEGVQIDIDELGRLARNQQWSEAAELIRGDFLEGIYLEDNLEFETWLLGERERRRQQAEMVFMAAAQAKQGQGEFRRAGRYLRGLLKLVPWHEEGHRQLMRLLAYEGNFSAALKQYEQCRTTLAEELDVFPSITTIKSNERIKIAMTMPPHNLPPQITPFVGREGEISSLISLLADPNCRLLTLTGVGGIGKTRLGHEIVRRAATNDFKLFLHGVAYVALTGTDIDDLITAVGSGLGIVFSGQQLAQGQLVDYLRKMEMLIFLDNYEQFLSDNVLVSTILREAPDVKLLVTSRERLNLQEEWLYEVEGLPYPVQDLRELDEGVGTTFPAVDLFTICAERIHRPISLDDVQNEVVPICRLVQGMPLALELVAARLRSLTLGDILAELERGLDILSLESRNMSPRHSSLRVTFDASWNGLTVPEQKVLSQLSLFRGGFTRQAAYEVARATLAVLGNLTDKSLIRLLPNGRYEIHELLRQFSAEKLENIANAREKYLQYYGAFLQQREQKLVETDQATTSKEIFEEIDNIRQAWRWAVEQHHFRFLEQSLWPMAFFYELRGWYAEAFGLIDDALTKLSQLTHIQYRYPRLLTRLNQFKVIVLIRMGRLVEGHAIMEQIDSQLFEFGDERDRAWARIFYGWALFEIGNVPACVNTLEEGVSIANAAGLRWLEAVLAARAAFYTAMLIAVDKQLQTRANQLEVHALALNQTLDNPWAQNFVNISCSRLAMFRGDYQASEHLNRNALTAARRIDNKWGIGVALFYLGLDKYLQEDADASRKFYEEGIQVNNRCGDKYLETAMFSALGELCRFQEDFNEACRFYVSGINICTEYGFTQLAGTVYCMYGHGLFGQGNWQEAWSYFHQSISMPGSRVGPTGDMTSINLLGLALVLNFLGKSRAAIKLLGTAEAQIEATFRQLWPADQHTWKRLAAELQEMVDVETYEAAWNEGKAMSLEEALTYALTVVEEKMPKF